MTRHTPQWLQAGTYPAAIDRDLIGALWPSPACSGMQVTVGSAMTLNVAAGRVAIPTGNATGSALCTSDATEQVTLSAAPASGTNRIDLVCAQVRGGDIDGGANNDWVLVAIAGAAQASPVPPATPANCVVLARVYVAGGTAAIVAGNITDARPGTLSKQLPRGIVATGPQMPSPAVGSILGLNQVLSGPASWLAANTITIPPGAGGLYLITGSIYYRSDAVVGINATIRRNDGSLYTPQLRIGGAVAVSSAMAHIHGAWLRQCADGDTFRAQSDGNAPASPGFVQMERLSLLRVGDSFADF